MYFSMFSVWLPQHWKSLDTTRVSSPCGLKYKKAKRGEKKPTFICWCRLKGEVACWYLCWEWRFWILSKKVSRVGNYLVLSVCFTEYDVFRESWPEKWNNSSSELDIRLISVGQSANDSNWGGKHPVAVIFGYSKRAGNSSRWLENDEINTPFRSVVWTAAKWTFWNAIFVLATFIKRVRRKHKREGIN